MRIESAIEFLATGSTKPFLAHNELGQKVVVKAMVRPTMGKILLNEYLAGNLAVTIGLPWPNTSLASLSTQAIHFLQRNAREVHSADCVAIQYVENLSPTNWPSPPQGSESWNDRNLDLLPDINRVHMQSYFDNPETQSVFYGRALFEAWLFFQDIKYDTLYVLPNKNPVFLDGSHAFGGSDWEIDQMDYSHAKSLPMSPYLEGILTHQELFEEWFNRIESVPNSIVSSLLDNVPKSWSVTSEQLRFLSDLLVSRRKRFIEVYKIEIENHYRTMQRLHITQKPTVRHS